jgi:hypothetical protein
MVLELNNSIVNNCMNNPTDNFYTNIPPQMSELSISEFALYLLTEKNITVTIEISDLWEDSVVTIT